MVKHLLNRKMITSIIVVLVLSVSLSACETLKKKFTRKKKGVQEVQDFQPVLEPQDYPAIENDPVKAYNENYDLVKAWYRDLWTGVEEKNNDRAVQYSIKQVLDHINQMKLLLKADKAKEFDQLTGLLGYYQTFLDQPRSLRNYSRIQSDLRAFDRMLRNHFREDKLKGEFIGK